MSGKFVELLCITLGSHSVAELAKVGLEDCTAVLIYISNQVSAGRAGPCPSRCDQFQHKISFDQKYNQKLFRDFQLEKFCFSVGATQPISTKCMPSGFQFGFEFNWYLVPF